MRGLIAGVLVIFLATESWAGLYNTSEPDEGKLSRDFMAFRDTLFRLRSVGYPKVEFDNPLRRRYLLQSELAGRGAPPTLSSDQKLNLGAVFVRTRKADQAVNLLVHLARAEPKNFLVHCNLATAYQQVGQDRRAIDTLEQALSVWPATLGEVEEPFRTYLQLNQWHEGSFDFQRKAETYHLKLLKLRAREVLAKKGATFTTVDALFGDDKGPVKFVAESGKFEVGKVASAEQAKLPKDAIDVVQQLLVWLPDDTRLYWLLGELYNAQGGAKNIKAARMIFDELGGFGGLGLRVEELAEHRRALLAHEAPDEGQTVFDLNRDLDDLEKKKKKDQGIVIDWRTLGVGFATGFILAVFGGWQIREIRRRRQARAAVK